MKTPNKEDFILFLHLQKTAGMTLQELLRRRYGPGFWKRSLNHLFGKSSEGLTTREALSVVSRKDRIFMGHFCFGVHRLLDFPSTYITFLREPASRLVSLYHYSRSTPTAHYYKVAKDMTCEEFLFECKLLEMDNGMTRLLAGDEDDLFINQTPYGKCDRSILEKALNNLDEAFSFVGIQEDFDRSILLFSKTFNWPSPNYISLNLRKGKLEKQGDDEAFLNRVRDRNRLDVELYETYRKRFAEEYNRMFPDGERVLEEFRNQNRKHQKWALPVYHLRSGCSKAMKNLLAAGR